MEEQGEIFAIRLGLGNEYEDGWSKMAACCLYNNEPVQMTGTLFGGEIGDDWLDALGDVMRCGSDIGWLWQDCGQVLGNTKLAR